MASTGDASGDGFSLGTAFVKVSPDTSDFAQALGDAVAASLRTVADRISDGPAVEVVGPLLIRLPDYMDGVENDHVGRHMALIGRAWMEVFPGLQARMDGEKDGKAVILFRLTPSDPSADKAAQRGG